MSWPASRSTVTSPVAIEVRLPDGRQINWEVDLTDDEEAQMVRHLTNYFGTPVSWTPATDPKDD